MKTRIYGLDLHFPARPIGIGHWLAAYGSREPDNLRILAEIVPPSAVIVDLGANIGYYALVESKLLSQGGRIHAIEPDPRNVPFRGSGSMA